MAKYIMWVLWPSFLAAGIGVGILFTLVDPTELVVLGQAVHASRTSAYSLGFFILWAICAAASALSCFLQATSHTEAEETAIEDAMRTSRPPAGPQRRRRDRK